MDEPGDRHRDTIVSLFEQSLESERAAAACTVVSAVKFRMLSVLRSLRKISEREYGTENSSRYDGEHDLRKLPISWHVRI